MNSTIGHVDAFHENRTYLLLNLDDNLLKNDDDLCWDETELVSWVWSGAPPGPFRRGLLSRVWPEWKVLRVADPLGKALLATPEARGDNPDDLDDELEEKNVRTSDQITTWGGMRGLVLNVWLVLQNVNWDKRRVVWKYTSALIQSFQSENYYWEKKCHPVVSVLR